MDQSYSLDCCFLVVLLLQTYICSFKSLLYVFTILMVSFKDKGITGTLNLVLFTWNIAPIVFVGGTLSLAAELAGTPGVLDISELTQSPDHDKSCSISQLIKGKSRDYQKLLNYFNETTTSVSDVLSLLAGVLPIIFVFYSLTCCLVIIYPIFTSFIIFIRIFNYFISIIILQTS